MGNVRNIENIIEREELRIFNPTNVIVEDIEGFYNIKIDGFMLSGVYSGEQVVDRNYVYDGSDWYLFIYDTAIKEKNDSVVEDLKYFVSKYDEKNNGK